MNGCEEPRGRAEKEQGGVPERASRAVLGALLFAFGIHGERRQELLDDLSAWTEDGLEELVGEKGARVLRRVLAVCVLGGAAAALMTGAGALVLAAVRLARGHRLTP